LTVTVSQIVITGTPTASPTSWQAKTDWTVISNGGTPRPCTALTPSNTAPISVTTIPPSYVTVVNGVNPVTGPLIIADVKYIYNSGVNFTDNFVPWFRWSSFGAFTFQRTAYAAVRNTYAPANIQYVGSITGGTDCP
jgi:hypothetical protein